MSYIQDPDFDVHFWCIAQQSENFTDVRKRDRNIAGLKGQFLDIRRFAKVSLK
jgi:hypothetical protein